MGIAVNNDIRKENIFTNSCTTSIEDYTLYYVNYLKKKFFFVQNIPKFNISRKKNKIKETAKGHRACF